MVKSSTTTPYCFVSGQRDRTKASSSSSPKYVLSIRQQPQKAKVCGVKERDRRPIDPPPIVQIKLAEPSSDRNKDYLQSPYLFMCCNLVHADDASGEIVAPAHRALAGTVVSSLNRLKDVDNSDGGFFVFGDMSVRIEGHFRLRFTLFELIEGQVVHVMSTTSNPMTVHSSKTFPGMSESTFLSRSFSDQGVRIRIRKDHHVKPKRPMSIDNHADAGNNNNGGGDGGNDVSQSPMHSPPSSCHDGEQSDNDALIPAHSSERTKSSSNNSSHRLASSSSRPRSVKTRYPSVEPTERTPPSSPGSYVGQDPAPSRPRHHPYAMEGYYEEYHRHASYRHHDPYYDYMPHHHEHPGYPPPPPHPSSRSGHGPRMIVM
ncbi:hypothetical protein BGZ83_011306 [Gryganskiella cystojenkinii]|nr:hypothetical protein BGZ83_011306 [Gryganskiella cystojenkinii]